MILTIDIGTTSCKAAIYTRQGLCVHHDRILFDPHAFSDDYQMVETFAISQALQTLMGHIASPGSIETIIVTGSGPSLVPVCEEPQVIDGVLHAPSGVTRLYLERNAVNEAREISEISGAFVDASFFLPKALRVAREEQELYGKTKVFLSTYDYINYLFTSEVKAIKHARDAGRWYYDDELLAALSLDERKFAPLIYPGDLIGTVSQRARSVFSLREGVKVVAGGPDFIISILGSGAVTPSLVCDRSGTSEGINVCSLTPIDDDRLMSFLHPVEPLYNISGIINTSGKAVSWVKELLNLRDYSFEELYGKVSSLPDSSPRPVFLPYLAGERAPVWDPDARGVFSGLTLSSDPIVLVRSVVEGTLFAVRDVIETIESCGIPVGSLRTIGGGSQYGVLQQMKADITGRSVGVPAAQDAEMSGAMILAQVADGYYGSLDEASLALVGFSAWYEPDERNRERYDELFAHYRHLYEALKGRWVI